MSQSIKDRIKTQIQINQQLLNYDDSDSQDYQDQEPIVVDLPKPYLHNVQQLNTDEIGEHQIMNQKRKRVLKDLQISSKQNMPLKYIEGQRVLRIRGKQNIINEQNNKQIIDLKSKLAQVFKESKIKQSKINILQQCIIELNNKIYELSRLNEQNQKKLVNKDNEINRLIQDNKSVQQRYNLQLKQYEREYKKRSDDIKQQIFEMTEILLKKQQHITLIQVQLQLKNKIIQEKSKQLQKKSKCIQQKNKSLQSMIKLQKKSIRCIQQNNKLKQDIKRLLSLVQNNIKTQNLLKSIKHNNSLINKQYYFKSIKSNNKSYTKSMKSQRRFNNNCNYNNNKIKHLSQLIQTRYSSLPANTKIKSLTSSQWFPTDLINQVQIFLKKYHIAHNNRQFVNHLVQFINNYTDKCINQNKSIMENLYKSLKKQIQRKNNQSLTMVQIMKQKQLKIKLNPSQNNSTSLKSAHKPINKYQDQNKHENNNLQSEYLSILVPASKNSLKYQRKNNLLSQNSINKKILSKDQIGYLNLQKSIKLHQQSSNTNFSMNIQSKNIQKIISNITHKDNLDKNQRKRYKTQSSPKFIKKQTNKNNSKKHKTITQTKYSNFPFKKYKII